MEDKSKSPRSPTRMFACLCCGSDKFHLCEDDEESFLSCAHCGLRSRIRIVDTCNMAITTEKNCPKCGLTICKCGKCHNCEDKKKGEPT
jgi:hypothetical protein